VDAWQMQCRGEPFAVGDAAAMIHGLERALKRLEEISGQMAGLTVSPQCGRFDMRGG
jgi:hypothetical protein